MSQLVVIDLKRCTGCGICVQVCPYRIIALEGGKAAVSDENCFLCGHCQAVCPPRAVRIDSLQTPLAFESQSRAAGDGPPTVGWQSLVELMESRRSCRNYSQRRVPETLLADLVRVGTLAPSGTNSQGWEFTIFPQRGDVELLGGYIVEFYRKLNRLAAFPLLRHLLRWAGRDALWKYRENYFESVETALLEWDRDRTDRLFHGATAVIIVSCRKDASCPAEDALLATQNMVLAAETAGLGSCLIGFAVEAMLRSPGMKKKAGIPDGEQVYSVVGLGYPAVKFLRPSGRREVRPRFVRRGICTG